MSKKSPISYLSETFIIKKGKISLGLIVRFSIKRKTEELNSLVFTPFIEITREVSFENKTFTKETQLLGKWQTFSFYAVETYRVWRILSLLKRSSNITSALIFQLQKILEEKSSLNTILQALPEEIDVEELKRIIVELPTKLEIDNSEYEFGRLSDFVITDPENRSFILEKDEKPRKHIAASFAQLRGLELIEHSRRTRRPNTVYS